MIRSAEGISSSRSKRIVISGRSCADDEGDELISLFAAG
jgi:hypothetical protein